MTPAEWRDHVHARHLRETAARNVPIARAGDGQGEPRSASVGDCLAGVFVGSQSARQQYEADRQAAWIVRHL